VQAVSNSIEVRSETEPNASDVERSVQEALAQVDGADVRSVGATLTNGTVRLHGRVSSVEALEAALEAAEHAPGVTAIESEIVVAQ
jgi:osmotically-inducible protein OsmY